MKKILSIVALSAVIFTGNAMSAADNAEAYFEDASLWRVVYDSADLSVEGVTDLGNVNTLLSQGSVNVGGPDDLSRSWDLTMFPGCTYSDLSVAYFGNNPSGEDVWVSGASGVKTSNNRKKNAIQNAMLAMKGHYEDFGTATVEQNIASAGDYSYNYIMNSNGTSVGSFNYFIQNTEGSESNLGALADENGVPIEGAYMEQSLYFWDENLNTSQNGKLVASLRTYADGSTTVNAVPVPATFLLFGSGLLSLMGVRRRTGK